MAMLRMVEIKQSPISRNLFGRMVLVDVAYEALSEQLDREAEAARERRIRRTARAKVRRMEAEK